MSDDECSICRDTLINPLTLICKHTYCKMCFEEWDNTQKKLGQDTQCPLCCRVVIPRINPKIKSIDSIIIMYLLEKLSQLITDAFELKGWKFWLFAPLAVLFVIGCTILLATIGGLVKTLFRPNITSLSKIVLLLFLAYIYYHKWMQTEFDGCLECLTIEHPRYNIRGEVSTITLLSDTEESFYVIDHQNSCDRDCNAMRYIRHSLIYYTEKYLPEESDILFAGWLWYFSDNLSQTQHKFIFTLFAGKVFQIIDVYFKYYFEMNKLMNEKLELRPIYKNEKPFCLLSVENHPIKLVQRDCKQIGEFEKQYRYSNFFLTQFFSGLEYSEIILFTVMFQIF